jgi:adenosylmethionine-8-amino-7-oxononanoate aminotransferase
VQVEKEVVTESVGLTAAVEMASANRAAAVVTEAVASGEGGMVVAARAEAV